MVSSSLLGVFRFGFRSSNSLLLPSVQIPQSQIRTIVSDALLKLPENFPEPWPYKEKGYHWLHAHYDNTTKRFHENSKLIILEGNVGCGKTKVGKEIADRLGFYFMPEFKMDDVLIDRYGNDMRNFYHLFPKRFRIPDINQFFENPYDDLSAVMQERLYYCRFEQYANALTHILNTGQGVVLERSVYADFVFVNAMRVQNYIGPEYFKFYYYVRKMTLPELKLYPHLMIYLDCPVSKCLENIKNRGNDAEIRVVNRNYLEVMAESYKDLLRELKRHSRILVYDWANPSGVDDIVYDIEKLEFDFFNWHFGDVLESWNTEFSNELYWNLFRMRITGKRILQAFYIHKVKHEVGELYIHPHDGVHYENVMKHEVLKSPFSYGYTPKDKYLGLTTWRDKDHDMPERWYEYYLKEAHLGGNYNIMTYVDSFGAGYDPEYLHHH